MHFIAMLAVKFPVAITYNSTRRCCRCLAVFTGVGLSLASARALGPLKIPVAAVLMGSGIGAMHYLGMSAVSGCGITYDYNWVAASLAVAVGASGVALWFAFRKRGAIETLLGGVVLGLATRVYLAMYATSTDYRCTETNCFRKQPSRLGCSGDPGYLRLLLIPVFVDANPRRSVRFGEGRGRISW
jgi:NO-binding membrane sensor protein with MHYT domain